MSSGREEEHAKWMEGWERGQDIAGNEICNMYKGLTDEDVKKGEAERFGAVIGVTDREGHDINLAQYRALARANGVPVVRWPRILDHWVEMPLEELLVQQAYNDA